MQTDEIIEVNAKKKKFNGILEILIVLFIIFVIVLYLVFLRKLTFFQDWFLTDFLAHVKMHIASFDLLGSFYIAFFGGLFFIFVPMEAYFFGAVNDMHSLLLYLVFIAGIFVSYSLDYLIGLKANRLAKKLVSPKKFYSIKTYINRYGKWAIFGANVIPFMPSQQVTFILGVFRYNKIRLLVLTIGGQIIKYGVILLLYAGIF